MSPTNTLDHATLTRSFVRNLNMSLKFAKMYGFDHARTTEQIDKTWVELQAALPSQHGGDLLLAASDNQLLLDGTPLGNSATDRSLARLFTGIGLSSVHFSASVTREDLAQFIRHFPSEGGAPALLAEKFKRGIEGVSGLRVNEICYVPTDSGTFNPEVAAQITAGILGAAADGGSEPWFNDPERLLQLIAAAEGSRGGGGSGGESTGEGGGGTGEGGGGGGTSGIPSSTSESGGNAAWPTSGEPSSGRTSGRIQSRRGPSDFWTEVKAAMRGLQVGSGPLMTAEQDDVCKILRLLRQAVKDEDDPSGSLEPVAFQSRLSTVSVSARVRFNDALVALSAQVPSVKHDKMFLVRLAEHLAIRYAVDTYERGDAQVSAVQELLERMGREIVALRDILDTHEAKMKDAGISVESHGEQLERQVWAAIPEPTKRSVLLSSEPWCVPPRHISDFVREQQRAGDLDIGRKILWNYLKGIESDDPESRRKTFTGLCDLAECYGVEPAILGEAITRTGARIKAEGDRDLRSLAVASFVRLSQEAAIRRNNAALQLVLNSLGELESEGPELIQSLHQRIGLEERLAEFLEDALRDRKIPDGLVEILQRLPRVGAKQLTKRFGQVGFREDCELLLNLFRNLGPEGTKYLNETLNDGPPLEAVETVGILSHIDPAILTQALPPRLRECPRSIHDLVVRRIALAGAKDRGRLLASLFDSLDPLIRSLALDEMGMSGDAGVVPWLIQMAEMDKSENALMRLKTIEALGRLHVKEAAPLLRRIIEEKQMFRWLQPAELRIVAAQTLAKIDPQAWQSISARADLAPEQLLFAALDIDGDASGVRQRRYPRLALTRPLSAVTTNLRENCNLEVRSLNLSGGLGAVERQFPVGTVLALKFTVGLRSVHTQVVVRENLSGSLAFEIAEISFTDRARLRQLLAEVGCVPPPGSAKNRVRRRRSPTRSKH